MARLVMCVLLVLCLVWVAQAQWVEPCDGTVVEYECDERFAAPSYHPGDWSYTPTGSPWTWSSTGGSASLGSPWDNAEANVPPGGDPGNNKYGFLHTNLYNGQATMQASVLGLQTATCSYLNFSYSVSNSQGHPGVFYVANLGFQWILGGTTIYEFPTTGSSQQLVASASGWTQVTTTPFYPTSATETLELIVTSSTDLSQTLLIGDVYITRYGGQCANN